MKMIKIVLISMATLYLTLNFQNKIVNTLLLTVNDMTDDGVL